MYAFTFNMLIANVWLLLSRDPGVPAFVIGFLIGFGLLALFRDLLPDGRDYVRRTLALFAFALYFVRLFVIANFNVAATVLFRSNDRLHPNFLTYDVSNLKPPEILLLSYCITLTPGTVSIRIDDTFSSLIIHALDAQDPDAIRAGIDRDLTQRILRFTR